MNLVDVAGGDSVTLAGNTLELDQVDAGAVRCIGFRPEIATVGAGPLSGEIRTVEDLGSEVFVHVQLEHEGETISIVLKTSPPFAGRPRENISFGLAGPLHLFDAAGMRVATSTVNVVS